MWFEPGQVPDTLPIGKGGAVFKLGFKTPPGGQVGSTKHVLNDHTYCCQLKPDICEATGEPQAKDAERCLQWHEKRFSTRQKDADRLGIPIFWSEFGACLDSDECVTEITQVADTADKYLAGWAYWQFKTYHDLTTSAGDRSEGFYNKDGSL